MNFLLTLLQERLFTTLREPWQNVLCQLVSAGIIDVVECFTVAEADVFYWQTLEIIFRQISTRSGKSLQFCSSSENKQMLLLVLIFTSHLYCMASVITVHLCHVYFHSALYKTDCFPSSFTRC